MTFNVNVSSAGVYDFRAILKSASYRGFFQFSMDGKVYGEPEDSHGSLSYYVTDFGNIKINSSGTHSFTFKVVGKNSSSSDYQIVFDKFMLTKLN